jgi:uncharacterized protein YndB with AHSA1/START domain
MAGVIDADALVVHLERVLPASRDVVFSMFTQPSRLAQWWGPNGFTTPTVEIDARVGGRYRIEMQPPEDASFVLWGEYLVVHPPERLSYTFVYEVPDPDDRKTVVSLRLDDDGGSTQLTLDHGIFATEARRALHEQGWIETLDRLRASST